MCGICGKVEFNGKSVEKKTIQDMCDAFGYRGPDDEGTYIKTKEEISVGLGHRRLSIIDLSKAGHQPMSNENGTIWIVYNGEIYNFPEVQKELKGKGQRFISKTDTETVIHAYEEWGFKCLDRFNGMFAFAIWDENKDLLFLARDRFGIKPLIYYYDEKRFFFASEIKSLSRDRSIPLKIDYEALSLYFTFDYIPAQWTICKGIRKLEPGHYIVMKNKIMDKKRWYDLTKGSSKNQILSEEDLKEELFRLGEDAVKGRMISDAPLGAFLSGGIDSSIIVGLMASNSTKPIKTFSVGYKDKEMFDETEHAREVARFNNTKH